MKIRMPFCLMVFATLFCFTSTSKFFMAWFFQHFSIFQFKFFAVPASSFWSHGSANTPQCDIQWFHTISVELTFSVFVIENDINKLFRFSN